MQIRPSKAVKGAGLILSINYDILFYNITFAFSVSEIYRIVSQKQLPDSPGGDKPGGNVNTVTINPTVDNNSANNKKCACN